MSDFLSTALLMVEEVERMHAKKITHRSLRPSSFLVDIARGKAWITHLETATLLEREQQPSGGVSLSPASLAYLSPEQSGRMNRSVDYRADLYSLGIIYYRMLVGRLPFHGQDPLEWMHSHIAKIPVSPHAARSEIPKVVSDIVMKLMAKVAEDRYQTAAGLKYDLQQCYAKWNAQGRIDPFELTRRDITEELLIPEKLYGRGAHVRLLLDSFDRVVAKKQIELVLVSGQSGVGKSSLIHEIHKPIVRSRGYFTSGKFDRLQRDIPLATVISAFGSLMHSLLGESENSLAAWKKKLSDALGSSGKVITDIIPELEQVIGPQAPVAPLSPTESQNRLNLALRNFVGALCSPEHPLVLFLDDLQWADPATLSFFKLIMSHPGDLCLLLIGAYRSNEVAESHPLSLTLQEIKRDREDRVIREILLQPLGADTVNALVADTLKMPASACRSLSERVHDKTGGNPFFINEFLKNIHSRKCLFFSREKGTWFWDLRQIEGLQITENVVDLMIHRIELLPKRAQRLLILAAFIGNTFRLEHLACAADQPLCQVITELWDAVKSGLVLSTVDFFQLFEKCQGGETQDAKLVSYLGEEKFSHDRVQQAAYEMIDLRERPMLHLKIGRQLLKVFLADERPELLFAVISHLNLAAELIVDERERVELARLNLEAAKKALVSNAYKSALSYATSGVKALGQSGWTEHYDLQFGFCRIRAECEFLLGSTDRANSVLRECFDKAKTLEQKTVLYRIKLKNQEAMGDLLGAIDTFREGAKMFGFLLPTERETIRELMKAEFDEFQSLMKGDTLENRFAGLAAMSDPVQKMFLGLISDFVIIGFFRDFDLYTLLSNKMVNITLKYGISEETAYGLALFSPIPRLFYNDYETTTKLGEISLDLIHNNKESEQKSRVFLLYPTWVAFWNRSLRETLGYYDQGLQTGIESGDVIWAAYNAITKSRYMLWAGFGLSVVEEECLRNFSITTQLSQPMMFHYTCMIYTVVVQLMYGLGEEGEHLKCAQVERAFAHFRDTQYAHGLGVSSVMSCWLYYLFDDCDNAWKQFDDASKNLENFALGVDLIEFKFIHSLLIARTRRENDYAQLKSNRDLFRVWAKHSPANAEHKYLLICAESARVEGETEAALQYYSKAIESANQSQYPQHEALAHELAGRFYLELGRRRDARRELTRAAEVWTNWGAYAKAKNVKEKYFMVLETEKAAAANDSTHTLDFMSILKASQAISKEIKLSQLTQRLLAIVLESAGAQKGYLILLQGDTLFIEGVADANVPTTHAQRLSVDACDELPKSILQYVRHTSKSLILENAATQKQFAIDECIQRHGPKSILCAPIVRGSALIGILYLENSLATGAFTQGKLEIVELLASQAAISIENATLYAEMEQRVEDRARELRTAQQKVLFSSKMAALGEMAGGISHEINTPLATISVAAEQIVKLVNTQPPDHEAIATLATNIVRTVFRIAEIIRGLRVFSRDSSKDPFQREGLKTILDSTLKFCREKLKSRGIDLIVDEVPEDWMVYCHPTQISQVLLNLLNNASDAVELLPIKDRWIRVSSAMRGDLVEFSVTDGGRGIPVGIQEKLFQPFFTTKEIGKGLGMGLSISSGIVQDHGGQLTLDADRPNTTFVVTLKRA